MKPKKEFVNVDASKIIDLGEANLPTNEAEEFFQEVEEAEKEIEEKGYAKQTQYVHLRMSPIEVSRAKKIAQKKGLKYQTYLKMRIKEVMDKDERELMNF